MGKNTIHFTRQPTIAFDKNPAKRLVEVEACNAEMKFQFITSKWLAFLLSRDTIRKSIIVLPDVWLYGMESP
jgi:hypothetical protein